MTDFDVLAADKNTAKVEVQFTVGFYKSVEAVAYNMKWTQGRLRIIGHEDA